MGCDIHCVVEVKGKAGWEPVTWDNKYFGKYGDKEPKTISFQLAEDRNYDTFAILANVRNGRGFAGCDTGDGFKSIDDPRGLPKDVHPLTAESVNERGDHSHSYVNLDELLAFDWAQVSVHRGWVNAKEFAEWDRVKEWRPAPRSYSGGVSGGGVVKITEAQMREKVNQIEEKHKSKEIADELDMLVDTYCQVQWEEMYSEAAGKFYTHVIPILKRLGSPDKVRLVFSFDS